VDAFWIKLIVLAILAGLFAATVWVTPRLFIRNADIETAIDPKARSGDS
jgi:hypothetical protein